MCIRDRPQAVGARPPSVLLRELCGLHANGRAVVRRRACCTPRVNGGRAHVHYPKNNKRGKKRLRFRLSPFLCYAKILLSWLRFLNCILQRRLVPPHYSYRGIGRLANEEANEARVPVAYVAEDHEFKTDFFCRRVWYGRPKARVRDFWPPDSVRHFCS